MKGSTPKAAAPSISTASRTGERRWKYRFQWYQHLFESIPDIVRDARRAGEEMGLDDLEEGHVGLYAGSSAFAGHLTEPVLEAVARANRGRIVGMRELGDELREVVKDVYGDGYDAAATNTCESALRVTMETLFAPPVMRRGDAYRARFIAPYNDDLGFLIGYGRPFPPKYKNLLVDRSGTAGELGVEGKSVANLDAILVRFEGVDYPVHGIRQNPVPLLASVDVDATLASLEKVAHRHAHELAGFAALGYDTPGYGYGDRDDDGVPTLKRRIGELARELDRPFLVDGASSCPFVGMGPDDVGADVMAWSMDKACRAPICGLLVGTAEAMVPIRKGLGLGGQRGGGVSSHSKAAYSFADPGRDSLVGLITVLRMLRDEPERVTGPVDRMHAILVEEIGTLPARLRNGILLTRSHTLGGVELNYEGTWTGEAEFGLPIFTDEDLFSNSNPMMLAQEAMGIHPATIYSGNMFLGPGMGTLREDGSLDEERMRLVVRALYRSMEIVASYAGV